MSDIQVALNSGESTVLDAAVVEEFGAKLRNNLITATNPEYEQVRRVWNGMIDRCPALIARCHGAADVVEAVNFARKHRLLVAVRAGGHNVAGSAVCEGGLLIDLSLMRGVHVDSAARTARVQGAPIWVM